MKLGDILINLTQTQFEVVLDDKNPKKFYLTFSWPYGLFPEGHIFLFNNYGKSLWNAKIDTKNVNVVPSENSEKSSLRTEIALMTTTAIDIKVLNEMKVLPFLKFCVLKNEDNSRLQLCSQEFYFSGKKDELRLKTREQSQKKAQVIINDQAIAGDQAIIFLNDPTQTLSLKAISENGASLEFETRMSPVDFQDVFLSEDKQKLHLRAEGAVPVIQDQVEFIGDKVWKLQLPAADPVLYLKGAGGVPLRQEFYLRGNVPQEKLRPYAQSPLQRRTYSDQIVIQAHAAEGTKPVIKDKNSGLKTLPDGYFQWLLKNLDVEDSNKRYMSFKSADTEFAVVHKIKRGRPFQAKVLAIAESPSSLLRGQFYFDWWWEHFLGLNTDSQLFHWGLQIEQDIQISRKDDLLDYSIARASLMYRFSKGFHFIDSSWGLKIPFQNLKTNTTSYNSFGLGFFYSGDAIKNSWIHWTQFDFNYFMESKSSDGNLRSFYDASILAFIKWDEAFSFAYGLELSQADFEASSDSSRMQLQGKLGFTAQF